MFPGSGINWKLKLGIGFGSAVFGVIIMCFGFCFWWRRHNKRRYYSSSYMSRKTSSYASSMADPEKNGTYHGVPIFKYRELEKATNYFDEKNELGDGGFGTVYKGMHIVYDSDSTTYIPSNIPFIQSDYEYLIFTSFKNIYLYVQGNSKTGVSWQLNAYTKTIIKG